MARQLTAALILVAGLAFVGWVAFGNDSTETAETPVATTSDTTVPADNESSNSAGSAEPENAADASRSSSTADDTAAPDTSAEDAEEPAPTAAPEPSIDEPENYGPRMDLVELDGWLQTDATSIDEFNGQVLLVEMWTFGCFNCKARIPHNQSYRDEFANENFQIIGVHAPEFSYEAEVENIQNAAIELGVTWPIALDTNKKNFRAWQPGTTNFWPRTYIIDQNGDIRYDHIGEGKYDEARETIRYLLENPPAPKT